MAKRSLTEKQHAMLAFIERFFDEHRRSPLIREIQTDCQIASYKSAIDRLNALEHKGFIKRVPNKHRGIKLVRRSLEPHVKPTAASPSLASAGQQIPA